MDTQKLIEELEKTPLPERVPLTFKNKLRRQLLNSPYFKKTSLRRSTIKYVISTAVTAAATAVIILYMMTPPTFSSANELLTHIESAYTRMAGDGQMHYLRTLFKTLSGRTPVEEEEWSYDRHRQFSIKTRNAVTGEELGHTIKTNGKMYSKQHEQIKFKFNIEEKSIPAKNNGKTITTEVKDLRVLVVPLPEDRKTLQVYIFNDSWTPESFSKRTPLEIVQTLKTDSLVTYAGRETSSDGDMYEVLEVNHSNDLYLFRITDDPKAGQTISKLIELVEKGESPKSEKIDVREIVKIDMKKNKIFHVSHSVRQNGHEIERFDLTFLEEKYLDYDPDIFNPQRNNLKELVLTE
ncbi:hypothetical protein F9K33_04235 [bacterium]|nr:MAG: hypothetical protein F9K33_04235 [bacterium]